jgi:hypothetical protein
MKTSHQIGQTITITTAQGTETGTVIDGSEFTPFDGEYADTVTVRWDRGEITIERTEDLS